MTPLTLHQSDGVQARPLLLFLLGGWQHRPMVLRLLFLQKKVCHKSAQKLVSLSSWVAFSSFPFRNRNLPVIHVCKCNNMFLAFCLPFPLLVLQLPQGSFIPEDSQIYLKISKMWNRRLMVTCFQ